VKVLEDTVLKPERNPRRNIYVPHTERHQDLRRPKATLNYAPITGPAPFLQRVEAESSKGSQDPVFQPIEIVKRTDNIPVNK